MTEHKRMPAVFFAHGSPMHALASNDFTKGWARIGRELPRPRAVLMVSAHWYVGGSAVTVSTQPQTIHDFGGFPRALYEVQYPAPGDAELAGRVQQLLAPLAAVAGDEGWGLDHGTWAVLRHVYPQADVPVVQLSIDMNQPLQFHYAVGQRLAELREEGVLVAGSGNIVHNLRAYAWGQENIEPYPWALSFEQRIREALLAGDAQTVVNYEAAGRDALLSSPTPDHYLPLLYVLGARQSDDAVSFPVEGMEGGSLSMLSVQFG